MAPAARHAGDPLQLRRLTLAAGELVLTLWTSDPALAARADAAGVERVGVDMERLGKRARQRGLGTWISPHTEDDLAKVQRQRTVPTAVTQGFQRIVHRLVLAPAMAGKQITPPPRLQQLLRRLPRLSTVPGYIIGTGVRPEHVPAVARRP